MRLDALMRPQSIAIVGASEKPTIGRRLIASLDRLGYAGRIYPINPNYPSVLGHQCYGSFAELPEAPDAAAFCLGHARVLESFLAAAERGIGAAVIYDGGFAELDEEGRALQARIAAICREREIALCGPNCMGILSPHHKSLTYMQELHAAEGLAGNVGIVSQSGGICIGFAMDVRRFGFSHLVSCGNEAVVTAAEFLEYLALDPNTRVIGGFIETVREPERFAAALDRAAAAGKPVVILQVGKTARSRQAALAHTGGPMREPQALSALFAAHGAIEVSDLVAFGEVSAAAQSEKRPRGRRIGVVTSSGGLAELILDATAAAGIELPPLPEAARAALAAKIGPVTGDGNPLDAWGSGTFAQNLPHAFEVFDKSLEHDAIVFCRDNCDGQPFDTPETARGYLDLLISAAGRSEKPHYLLHPHPGVMDRSLVAHLRAHGIAVLCGIREGLGAIVRLARISE
ncbi:MAG TPA: CoA-binding protein [Stellaceae bacterium]|nr:CoA-binding protein [Stellaceae bacterium]